MLRILHLADLHLGSGLSHGRINPATGRNTRLEDFILALSRCIDYALSEPVDLVLFGGDAFPTATPEPTVQEEFARQFMRLAQAQIPVVFLVGNHDQYNRGGGGASLDIYSALQIPGFTVGNKFKTHRLTTIGGDVQIVTLPWLHRSSFLTKDATRGLTLDQVDKLMQERLHIILRGEIKNLDPNIPAILLAHTMVETATFGVERHLAIGRGFTVPLEFLAQPEFAYVALGHVHRHQILCTDPPVVYPGSPERVDFGEEKEEKGFMRVDILPDSEKNFRADYQFVPLPARVFKTIRIDCSTAEDPQQTILQALSKIKLAEAIIKVVYSLHQHQAIALDSAPIHALLQTAFAYQLVPQVPSQLAQPRVPAFSEQASLDPFSALGTYLDNQEHLKPLRADLLKAAQNLMTEDPELATETLRPGQLRLL